MAKHPGFKAVQQKIEGEGYRRNPPGQLDEDRGASAAAKKKNPRLKSRQGEAPRSTRQAFEAPTTHHRHKLDVQG